MKRINLNSVNVIEASAGTGKTHAIANLYVILMLEKGLFVKDILVVTFTVAAAKELKARLRKRLKNALNYISGNPPSDLSDPDFLSALDPYRDRPESANLLRTNINNFDMASVFTIHGFCLQVLRDSAFESGELFDTEIITDADPILSDILRDFWRNNISTLDADIVKDLIDEKFISMKYFAGLQKELINRKEVSFYHSNDDQDIETTAQTQNIGTVKKKKPQHKPSRDYKLQLSELFADTIASAMERGLRDKNIWFYDTLIERVYNAVKSGKKNFTENIRSAYRAALIDEFQDTDRRQFEIFSTIFGKGSPLFLIGDPKQSIYGFRGADIHSYLSAVRGREKNRLDTNWRSDSSLVESVNMIFSSVSNPFLHSGIEFTKVSSASDGNSSRERCEIEDGNSSFNIWFIDRDSSNQDKYARYIKKPKADKAAIKETAAEISRILKLSSEGRARIGDRKIEPGDIAVLINKNRQAGNIHDELRQYSIPSVLYGSDSVFKTDEAEGVLRILNAIDEPANDTLLNTALSTRIIGFKAGQIIELMDNEFEREKLYKFFNGLKASWNEKGFIYMFRKILNDMKVYERLSGLVDGERSITNINHLIELISRAELDAGYGIEGSLKWLRDKIDSGTKDEEQIRLDSDDNAVKIITIHRSKGLEFPIVFTPFIWEIGRSQEKYSLYYDEESQGYKIYIHDKNEKKASTSELYSDRDRLAENIRLMYVALTRAKYRCYMAMTITSNNRATACSYLLSGKNFEPDAVPASLYEYMKDAPFGEIFNNLKDIEKRSGGRIRVIKIKGSRGADYKREYSIKDNIGKKIFSGEANQSWKISSYSSLTSKTEIHETPLRELSEPDDGIQETIPGHDIFSFPRGAVAGSCIHSIFENIDFTESKNHADIVSKYLKYYSFDADWQNILKEMVHKVLSADLYSGTEIFNLKSVQRKDRLTEAGFYFPVTKFYSDKARDIFSSCGMPELQKYSNELDKLNFKHEGGYITGFMDSVVRHGHRYYIIDWKSNHLGNSLSDYNAENLHAAMRGKNYILQGYIYSIALNRYLSARLKNEYDFNENFGGFIYLFVRGIGDAKDQSGIYHHLPEKKIIAELNMALS